MRQCCGFFVAGLVAALLSACAGRDNLVVVLPESNGHVGAVVVHAADSPPTVLNKAYAAAGENSMKPVAVDPQEVNRIFGSALAAQPIPPKNYLLYFMNDSDKLVPESMSSFEAVFTEISRRKAAEIVVTGHTDTMGTSDYNDRLSLERAKAVSLLFIGRGLPAESVLAVGRGERDLLVQTPDQVSEPRNRRVEITVR